METKQTKGETMRTAAQAVQSQHTRLLMAIELLQSDLNKMTSEIDPNTESWADVAKFAHAADLAQNIIERYEEN